MKYIVSFLLFFSLIMPSAYCQDRLIKTNIYILSIDSTGEIYNYLTIESLDKSLEGYGLWYHKNLKQFRALQVSKNDKLDVYIRRSYPGQFVSGTDTITLKGHALQNPPYFEGKEMKYYQLVEILN